MKSSAKVRESGALPPGQPSEDATQKSSQAINYTDLINRIEQNLGSAPGQSI